MEMFELRYFLAVAQHENIHRASEELNVSPGSFSKAIGRLEDELGVALFYKQGRNIHLTPEGLTLKVRAAHIIQMEEATKVELSGKKGNLECCHQWGRDSTYSFRGRSLQESTKGVP